MKVLILIKSFELTFFNWPNISQLASLFDKIKEDIPIFFDKATTKLENREFVIDDESSLTWYSWSSGI